MCDKQLKHKQQKDKHRGAERAFAVGERVYAKCVRGESISWDDGTVTQVVSPVTYLVRMAGGQIRFMHADHMRHAFARPVATEPVSVRVDEARVRRDEQPSLVVPPTQPSDGASIPAHCSTSADAFPTPDDGSAQSSPIHPTSDMFPTPDDGEPSSRTQDVPHIVLRRGVRERRPPDRFQHEDFRK